MIGAPVALQAVVDADDVHLAVEARGGCRQPPGGEPQVVRGEKQQRLAGRVDTGEIIDPPFWAIAAISSVSPGSQMNSTRYGPGVVA